jgi:hypothetical protein
LSKFNATIREAPRGGAYVAVPARVVEELGGGGRMKVTATFDGIDYRGSIVRMGGESVLGLLKDIRDKLGKGPGDEIVVTVEPDFDERVVAIPPELADLFEANPAATEAFESLSYSHRREHAMHVAEAKKPETRERRAAKVIESLLG